MSVVDFSSLGNITIKFSEPIQRFEEVLGRKIGERRLQATQADSPTDRALNLTRFMKAWDIIQVNYTAFSLQDDEFGTPYSSLLDWSVADMNETFMVLKVDFD